MFELKKRKSEIKVEKWKKKNVFSFKVELSLITNLVAHQTTVYPGFCSMKRLGVFLLPSGLDARPSQGYPPALSLYTWVERGTVRVK